MIRNFIINVSAFAILPLLWFGFIAALVFNPAILDNVWHALRCLPLIVQGVAWLLVLPVALGIWIWKSSWPIWICLLVIISLGVWTISMFFPRQT